MKHMVNVKEMGIMRHLSSAGSASRYIYFQHLIGLSSTDYYFGQVLHYMPKDFVTEIPYREFGVRVKTFDQSICVYLHIFYYFEKNFGFQKIKQILSILSILSTF